MRTSDTAECRIESDNVITIIYVQNARVSQLRNLILLRSQGTGGKQGIIGASHSRITPIYALQLAAS